MEADGPDRLTYKTKRFQYSPTPQSGVGIQLSEQNIDNYHIKFK